MLLTWQNTGGSSVGGVQPTFASDLITSLVPRQSGGSLTPTFTAASTRYVRDFEGLMKLVLSGESRFTGARRVQNLATYSEAYSNAAWLISGTGASKSGNAAIFGANANNTTYQAVTVASNASRKYTASMKLSVDSGTKQVNLFNDQDGVATTAAVVTVTTTPTWFSVTRTNSSSAGTIQNFGFNNSGIATAGTVNVLAAQLEDATGQSVATFGGYVSTNVISAPYHGANVDGVQYFATENGNTVASNVVTEATGAAISSATLLGYQAEGARADVLGATAAIRRTMADAGWVAGATMTLGSATGIDGVASAGASLTGGAVEATNTILFTTVLASAARTYSAWVRRKTGTGTVRMTDNNGTNWTDITLTTTYTQFQLTRTQANPVVGFQIATNLDAIEVDFNTIEAASFANPTPIPVNVSKAADVLSYEPTGNINLSIGTVYAEFSTVYSAAPSRAVIIGSAANNNSWAMGFGDAQTGLTIVGNTGSVIPVSGAITYPVTTPIKAATTWNATAVAGTFGGATPTTGTIGSAMATWSGLGVGVENNVNQPFGAIRNVKIWPVALPAATLQALTT